jgi:hypothetical protein
MASKSQERFGDRSGGRTHGTLQDATYEVSLGGGGADSILLEPLAEVILGPVSDELV